MLYYLPTSKEQDGNWMMKKRRRAPATIFLSLPSPWSEPANSSPVYLLRTHTGGFVKWAERASGSAALSHNHALSACSLIATCSVGDAGTSNALHSSPLCGRRLYARALFYLLGQSEGEHDGERAQGLIHSSSNGCSHEECQADAAGKGAAHWQVTHRHFHIMCIMSPEGFSLLSTVSCNIFST